MSRPDFNLDDDITQDVLKRLALRTVDDAVRVASSTTDPETWADLADLMVLAVDRVLAARPQASQRDATHHVRDHYVRLLAPVRYSLHADQEVRVAALANIPMNLMMQGAVEEALGYVAGTEESDFLDEALAHNPTLTGVLQIQLATHHEVRVRRVMAAHPMLDQSVRAMLAGDDDFEVRKTIWSRGFTEPSDMAAAMTVLAEEFGDPLGVVTRP